MKKIVLFGFMAVCILLAECFKESRCLLPITEIQTEESHDIVYLHHPQSSLQIWRTDESVKIPLLSQNPVLPNGCEVTSLAMVLSSAGYPVEPVELYEQYLPVRGFTYVSSQRDGPSPEEFYVGDATSRNGGMVLL